MGEKGTGENFVESMGEKSMCEQRWLIKKHG